jgi:hypothetical protein
MQDMTRTLRYLFVLLFVSIAGTAFAQSGAVTGTVLDEKKEPMIGAIVQVLEGSVVKGGGATDVDGVYYIKPLAPGKYDVEIKYSSYKTSLTKGVLVRPDGTTTVNASMEVNTQELDVVNVVAYKVPLIEKNDPITTTITSDQIEKMPTRTTEGVAATAPGVYSGGTGLNIGGARSDGTLYIVDGIQVRGSAGINMAQNSIGQIQVLTSGLPARYGDAIGGVINITTKGFSEKYQGNVLVEHSVDGYNHNLVNATLSGPLYSKKVNGVKKPKIGFLISGDGIYDEDPRPVYGGVYKVKDDVLANLEQNPLVPNTSQSGVLTFRPATEYVRNTDLEVVKKRSNARSMTGRLNAKLDFQIAENLNLTTGGTFSYNRSKAYAGNLGFYSWSLFSSDAIPEDVSHTGRGYIRLTQRFGKTATSPDEKKPLISNAFYTLQADYQTSQSSRRHEDHGLDLFKYGYAGKFNTDYISVLAPGVDDSTQLVGIKLTVDRLPIRTTFERSELNPILANYTSQYYNLLGFNPASLDQIRATGGMTNGHFPNSTYSVFTNVGNSLTGFNFRQEDQFAVNIDASFDLQPGKTRHAIEFGLYYQQRVERFYGTSMTQGAGLWQYMRLLTNRHIQLDFANPVFVVNGNRYTKEQINSGVVSFSPFDTILYNRIALDTAQSVFDKNLRTKLGAGATDYINIDAYDPSMYSLDMFSADELLNNNNSFVNYFGYDYTGKKQRGQVNFNDFFTKKDANGNFTRDIGAYRPNYIAGYILDKFEFKDVNFNVGMRIDRFDNNTKVLKDPYSIYEVRNLGDARAVAKNEFNNGHPANIGDDYVVYVNNNETANPTVIGYRNGDDWYDPYGRQIEDPTALKAYSGGRDPQPFLVDKNARITDSTFNPNSSFTDYKPQVNVMPRVQFSFPISDVALFYAHYDVIVQRPRTGAYATPADYFFINSNNNGIIQNSDLKPEKMFDYEVGFKQVLTKQSALTLSGFYKERKDMITIRPYLYAWPRTYYTFGNRDFSTTKGLKLTYDLRRTGNLRMNIAYTLQFADGSGSGVASGNGGDLNTFQGNGLLQNFISAQLPNLRFGTPLSYDSRHMIVATVDYRFDQNEGPVMNDNHFLQNAGVNFIFSTRSGEPYTKYLLPNTKIVESGINNSRYPWHYNLDMRIDKDFELSFRKKDATSTKQRQPLVLNAYVLVYNLLNTRDVTSIDGYTGRPDDDGYLTSPQGIQFTQNQSDPISYIDLYSISRMNPNNVNLPRRINLGLQLNF